jgi:hypothetical protein
VKPLATTRILLQINPTDLNSIIETSAIFMKKIKDTDSKVAVISQSARMEGRTYQINQPLVKQRHAV